MPLYTKHLLLLPATTPLMDLIVAGDWPALSQALGGVTLADHWNHFPEAQAWIRDHLREHPGSGKWWNYLIVHQVEHALIGTCGFKGAPSGEGTVEIGYEIADGFQGRGLATEAARALVAFAWSHDTVRAVIAHTLAQENASAAVLRKIGFAFVTALDDPDDGPIWRWQLLRP